MCSKFQAASFSPRKPKLCFERWEVRMKGLKCGQRKMVVLNRKESPAPRWEMGERNRDFAHPTGRWSQMMALVVGRKSREGCQKMCGDMQ